MEPDETEEKVYKVVVNDEKQHSIWPADRENTEGWSDVGKTGTQDECQAYVNDAWADAIPSLIEEHKKD
jgi:MbtH protein